MDKPIATVNNTISTQERLSNNMKYRNYVQGNGNSARSYNLAVALSDTCAILPNTTIGYIEGPPHLFKTCDAPQAPKYQSSDLKEWYFKAGHL